MAKIFCLFRAYSSLLKNQELLKKRTPSVLTCGFYILMEFTLDCALLIFQNKLQAQIFYVRTYKASLTVLRLLCM